MPASLSLFFSLFFVFPSLYQAAFTLLSCKKNNTSVLGIPQYTIPFVSIHLSVLDTSSQGEENNSLPLPIPDFHPVSVSTEFIGLFEYIFLLFHELRIKSLSSVGCSVPIFTSLPEESVKDPCPFPNHFDINASFHYGLKKIHLS